uniref:Uncharacterized protein n=1 Tax=Hyaloperonospora arabidopsidis (strain Emoy2) TaxID=559515 RepID=M4B8R1_HYAAE
MNPIDNDMLLKKRPDHTEFRHLFKGAIFTEVDITLESISQGRDIEDRTWIFGQYCEDRSRDIWPGLCKFSPHQLNCDWTQCLTHFWTLDIKIARRLKWSENWNKAFQDWIKADRSVL